MSTTSIKSQITKHIKSSMGSEKPRLNNWYVGITNNLDRRKAEHNKKTLDIKFWKTFDAKTMKDANVIEAYFNTKGTINQSYKGGAIKTSKYVYVFKKPISKPQGLNGAFTNRNLISQLFEQ